MTFDILKKLAVPVLLGTTFIDRVVRSIHPTGKVIVPHHYTKACILIINETRISAEKNKSHKRQNFEEDVALFVTPAWGDHKNIAVSGQIVLKAMCETPVLVFTKSVSIIEANICQNVARNPTCLRAKGIMSVYQCCPFHITIAKIGKIDVHISKHKNGAEAANAPLEIVYMRHDPYSYAMFSNTNKSDCSINSVHYKLTPDLLQKDCKTRSRQRKDKKRSKIGIRTYSYRRHVSVALSNLFKNAHEF